MVLTALPSALAVELPNDGIPALISADEIIYDENLNLVTARGNVEVSQDDRIVIADLITYAIDTEVVTASGNVTLLDPSGEIVFAEYAEISGGLREAFIRDIRVLLTDRSRMAGANAQRSAGRYNILNKGVFSPCELCRDDPSRAPLWQLKADQIVHDETDKVIEYYDAWMEIYGVPVLYTPYFSHPDPTVKRKSGFLAPGFGGSDTLGTTITVPFFWVISDDKDVTLEPIFTTEQGIVMAADYRQRFVTGELRFKSSATFADRTTRSNKLKENAFRGHVESKGRFNIDETWRWGFDLNRATDDTYLRVYDLSGEAVLESEAFVEGFRGRNYGRARVASFQGVRAGDDNGLSPIIAPMLEYSMVSEPGVAGGIYRLDSNILALTRVDGQDTRRASVTGSFELPYTGSSGEIITLSAGLQADAYWTDGDDPNSNVVNSANAGGNEFAGRIFPQATLRWQYPWVQANETWQQVVEPIVQIVASPNDFNPNDAPNEDSLGFEFDDTNIFNANRFPGTDLVDSGTRVDYGMRWSGETFDIGNIEAFVGQSVRITGQEESDELFNNGSGLESRLSDIVGRVRLDPDPNFGLLYRFRLDKENLKPRRSEIIASIGPPALRLSLDYLFLDSEASNNQFADREEALVGISSRLTEHWRVAVTHRRDLEADRNLSSRFTLTYSDECFLIQGAIARKFFRDGDLEPEDSFFVRVSFKHLGQFGN